MRRFLSVPLAAIALLVAIAPAGAQTTILDRPPMDLGADQIGVLQRAGEDLLFPARTVDTWFDAGTTFPVGNLKERNIDPGLLVRFNDVFWRDGSLSMFGSVGALFGNDSYFNDAQNAIAAAAPPSADPSNVYSGIDIQSRYFWMVPATINLAVSLPVAESVSPFVAFGPGVVWTHESMVTSAVNDGVGSQTLGGDAASDDPVLIGRGGEQGISPYAIRSSSKFHPGFDLRGGIGFRTGSGDRPMWIRGVLSSSTYFDHSHPSTNLGIALSFGR